jgi:hypothetical protein
MPVCTNYISEYLHLYHCAAHAKLSAVRIAKPILLVSTPVGMIGGLHEAYRLTGGLAVLMAMMMGLLCVAAASIVLTIRRESAAKASSPSCGASRPEKLP